MAAADPSFSSEHAYLKQHQLSVYFEDCVRSLLEARRRLPSIPSVKCDVNVHLRDYFIQVKRENHVIGREYSFINGTPYNRRAFLTHLWSKCDTAVPSPTTLKEVHALMLSICPDFPYSFVETSATLIDEIESSLTIDYVCFLRAFQLNFLYDEFIFESQQLFRTLSHRLTCHVPTGEITISQQQQYNEHRHMLIEALEKLIQTNNYPSPPLNILQDALPLSEHQQFNHQKFLIYLAKNEKLSRFIGKEPVILRQPRLTQQQQQLRPVIESIVPTQCDAKLVLTSISTPNTRISSPIAPPALLPPLPKQQVLVREKPIRQGSPAAAQLQQSKRSQSASSLAAIPTSARSTTMSVTKQDPIPTDSDVESRSSDTDT